MDRHLLTTFKNSLSGELVTASDAGYDDLRKGFVRAGSPAIIVRCRSNEDVAAAIRFAREQSLTLSVRSGGHSMAGLSTNDGGLVLDISYFNQVDVIDSAQHIVRIGAGARWGDAAKALDANGLAISSGDTNSVGVGGLTLGGGIGWMVRKYGLTIDSLEAAEIVLADGRFLRVSKSEHPDLFWAIRGGGGNFGVVTAFEFRAHPVGMVLGGMAIYSMAEINTVLTGWAGYMRSAPEELNSTFIIFPGFGGNPPPALMVLLCYAGEGAAAEKAVRPLLELGALQNQTVQAKPYYQMLEDAKAPPGLKSVAQNGFIKTLDVEVIAALAASYGRPGTPIVQLRSLGGAFARVSADATAFAHRDYEAFVLSASLTPFDTPAEQVARIKQAAWEPIKPFARGAYVNFSTDVDEASIDAAYPSETYRRLVAIKSVYDPENIFNQNANIQPAR